jgi:hypothetical protein
LHTKIVKQREVLNDIRDKRFEEGWLKDHDRIQKGTEHLRIDLRNQKKGIMNDILAFNELLFQ